MKTLTFPSATEVPDSSDIRLSFPDLTHLLFKTAIKLVLKLKHLKPLIRVLLRSFCAQEPVSTATPSPQNMAPAWGHPRRLPARQQVEPSASAVTRERLRLAYLNFCCCLVCLLLFFFLNTKYPTFMLKCLSSSQKFFREVKKNPEETASRTVKEQRAGSGCNSHWPHEVYTTHYTKLYFYPPEKNIYIY